MVIHTVYIKYNLQITKKNCKTTYWKLTLGDDVKRQCVVFSRKYENFGFQNLVITYWPSSWLGPFSLCGEVTWSWISNASRTFRSNLLSSTLYIKYYNCGKKYVGEISSLIFFLLILNLKITIKSFQIMLYYLKYTYASWILFEA